MNNPQKPFHWFVFLYVNVAMVASNVVSLNKLWKQSMLEKLLSDSISKWGLERKRFTQDGKKLATNQNTLPNHLCFFSPACYQCKRADAPFRSLVGHSNQLYFFLSLSEKLQHSCKSCKFTVSSHLAFPVIKKKKLICDMHCITK